MFAVPVRRVFSILVTYFLLLFPQFASAHDLKQIKSVIEIKDDEWSALVNIEAWALYPEAGKHVPPEEAEVYAGKIWAETLDANDFAVMKKTASTYLKDCLQLSLGEKSLDYEVIFERFENATPIWEYTEKGQAVFQVKLSGKFPNNAKGPLLLKWEDYQDEPLALQVATWNGSAEKQTAVMRIESKKTEQIALIDATSTGGSTSKNSSLLTWIIAGFEHILPKGLDHILFILGLFLLQPNMRALLWQSTAFTVAHSITLGMVVMGWCHVSSSIVEPAIAISIVYVAAENLWVKELKPWRVGLIFCLGLLHGMGFASVMQELDIPAGSVMKPLLGFNLGVEFGQVMVLIATFIVTFPFLKKPIYAKIRLVGSLMIALTGLYWTVERIAGW